MSKETSIEWLKVAYTDLIMIEEIVDNDYLSHMVGFHSHQSVEKSFKAILEFHMENVPPKHDLIFLVRRISKYIKIDNKNILEELNILYTEFKYRYPNKLLHFKPTLENAKGYYLFANDIFDKACNVLDISVEEILS